MAARRIVFPLMACLLTAGSLCAAPRDVRVAGVTDCACTVVWTTAAPEAGCVRYGRESGDLPLVAYDVRGRDFVGMTHCVVITGLTPTTTYRLVACSESASSSEMCCTTGPVLSIPLPDQIYGQVVRADGRSPEGALVTIILRDANGTGTPGDSQPLVCLVSDSGWWTVNIGSIRTADGTAYFSYAAAGDRVCLSADAGDAAGFSEFDTAHDTPAPPVVLTVK